MKSLTMQPAGSEATNISHLNPDSRSNLQVAGCEWAASEIRWYRDSLKENCLPILLVVTTTRILPLNGYSTTHMVKKSRASWKDRMIKTGDNVMVGGRPTDIVIPCDSILWDRLYIFYLPISVLWAQQGLERALYAPRDLESFFSLTTMLPS